MDLFLTIGLTTACLAALIGLGWRVRAHRARPTVPTVLAWLHNTLTGLFRGRWLIGLADLLLLRRTWRTSGLSLRWAGHMLLALPFLGLLVLHALDNIITLRLFPDYMPTLDPWQWLRNLCGLLALIGLTQLAWHRWTRLRLTTGIQDWIFLALLAAILGSGFFLEASKIISPDEFSRMQEDYFPEAVPDERTALKAYWQQENGVLFRPTLPADEDTLALGAELHEDHCAPCHAPTASAFISRGMAELLPSSMPAPIRGHIWMWYVHVGLALLTLVLLPWGKFLHPLTTPANLLNRAGSRQAEPEPSPLGLQACTRCGQCSLHCSVIPSFAVLHNPDILPMSRLKHLRDHQTGSLSDAKLADLVEGSHICTECLRCTDICSAGIDLQSLWMHSKQKLVDTGRAGVDGEIRKRTAGQWAHDLSALNLKRLGSGDSGLADNAASFWGCVQCTTCTSVCPVVAVCDDPARDLDLTPQQIMNLLRMGLKAETVGARMVWSCTTCYKCQEHCPQGVPVADILYELRGLGAQTLRGPRSSS